ncbi:hypothetical protein BOX15_Mlig034289g3, partial [Macrostomum lignano]
PSPLTSIRLCGVSVVSRRCLHSSGVLQVGRTWESKPVPGSVEHLQPQAWAKRLFDLHAAEAAQKQKLEQSGQAAAQPEPTKVLMIRRLLPWKASTYYEKCLLYKLGMEKDTPMRQWLPLPNIPSVADDLRKVQHLLQIQPLTMPDGLPATEADLSNCYTNECGELRMRRRLAGSAVEVQPERHAEAELEASKRRIHSMPRYHERRWKACLMFSEYFTQHHRYQHMQDGSAYRYSGLWRRDAAMKQSLSRRTNPDGTKRPNLNFEADFNAFPWRNY